MSHTHTFCGRETSANVLGKPWTFSRWDLRVWDDYTDWARTQLPDPIANAIRAIERMTAEEEKITDAKRLASRARIKDELVEAATKQAAKHLDLASEEVQGLINSPRGGAHLLMLLLRKNHPDIDEDTAFSIWMDMTEKDKRRVMETTSGKSPPAKKD